MDSTPQPFCPLPADFASDNKGLSILFSILPSAVQSRLPSLSSLRRSTSMYALATSRKIAGCRPRSGSQTPETAMVLSGTRMNEEVMAYEAELLNSDEDIFRMGRRKQAPPLTESKSGIEWKFANQGLNLLSLAVDESSTISQDPRFGNPTFSRQLYLHAITYLLRALPLDLTTEEQLSIRSALPTGVVEPLHIGVNTSNSNPNLANSESQPSLLHRLLASTIVRVFIIFQFLLPYLKCLLSAAYQYERRHKISEKLLSQSIHTMDLLGKQGLSLTECLCGMGDGKVGYVIVNSASWFVESVTGGIHEGIGEGMVIMGARKYPPPPPSPEMRLG